ncbi:hypothetical protein NDU88_007496 [Pleurodeles waltl]|uniref:Secreted protein n=1 Tax=Pleurodeles waltl TaxID=8319 RepID=A0AAV7RUY8_PLEWA|nr:hypothetical protein NDU88_007496 [Pleurodeles waltl]
MLFPTRNFRRRFCSPARLLVFRRLLRASLMVVPTVARLLFHRCSRLRFIRALLLSSEFVYRIISSMCFRTLAARYSDRFRYPAVPS